MPDSKYTYVEFSYLESITGGDKDTEQTILEMLLVDMEQLCPTLNVYYESGNIEALEKATHKLRSSLAFSGNEQIMKSNDELLEIARTQTRLGQAPALITKIEDLAPLIIQELQQKLQR